jgi:hypothetical protein
LRAVDARLDGADRAAADMGGLFVGKSGCADQNERLALVGRQMGQRFAGFDLANCLCWLRSLEGRGKANVYYAT